MKISLCWSFLFSISPIFVCLLPTLFALAIISNCTMFPVSVSPLHSVFYPRAFSLSLSLSFSVSLSLPSSGFSSASYNTFGSRSFIRSFCNLVIHYVIINVYQLDSVISSKNRAFFVSIRSSLFFEESQRHLLLLSSKLWKKAIM